MPNWFHRSRSTKLLNQHPEKDNEEQEAARDTVTTTTTTTSNCCCGGPLLDSRTMQHSRSVSFSHRDQRRSQQQSQPLHASSDHDGNNHRRHDMAAPSRNDMKKNRAVYIKTGNHLYSDIDYYEYTIPNFQRQGPQQDNSSSKQQQQQQRQQQQQQRLSPPTSPTAVSSLGSSLSSVHSPSYTDEATEVISKHRDDNRSKRILSEFAMSAYLTAECS